LRNLSLLGHGSSGKTTLSEAMLFNTGAITRRGRVEDGTTVSDWDDEEIRRGISVNVSLVPCLWHDHKINLLDTPGFIDFVGEVKAAVSVADAGLVLVDAVAGVEVGTELGWAQLEDRSLPRAILVNKMDRENARFQGVLVGLRNAFGGTIIPAQLPIGEGPDFKGVIDLISRQAYLGDAATPAPIPDDMADAVDEARMQLIEASAEGDDELIMKYLDGEELSPEEVRRGFRAGVANGHIIPVFCGSASTNNGIRALMDAVVAYLPGPIDVPGTSAERPNGDAVALSADPSGPLAVYVFKTLADPYVGKISYFRVFSGTFSSDSRVYSLPSGTEERVGQLFSPRGKEQVNVVQMFAGDIGGVTKLGVTATNDTLCDRSAQVALPRPTYPEPLFSVAVSPKTKADSAKMGPALTRMVEEDPTLTWRMESGTNQTILSGMGEVHIDLAERMV